MKNYNVHCQTKEVISDRERERDFRVAAGRFRCRDRGVEQFQKRRMSRIGGADRVLQAQRFPHHAEQRKNRLDSDGEASLAQA